MKYKNMPVFGDKPYEAKAAAVSRAAVRLEEFAGSLAITHDHPLASDIAEIVESETHLPELIAAAKAALARIESDVESDSHKITEGDALRAVLAKVEKE